MVPVVDNDLARGLGHWQRQSCHFSAQIFDVGPGMEAMLAVAEDWLRTALLIMEYGCRWMVTEDFLILDIHVVQIHLA